MIIIILSEPSILKRAIGSIEKCDYNDVKVKKYIMRGNYYIETFTKSLNKIYKVFEYYYSCKRFVSLSIYIIYKIIEYKLCGEIQIHIINIMNKEIQVSRFFEPILKDTKEESFKEYFKYFIPFHKYFNDKKSNQKLFEHSLNKTAWIKNVYPNDYIRIKKYERDEKDKENKEDKIKSIISITSIISGNIDNTEEEKVFKDFKTFEPKLIRRVDYITIYEKSFENKFGNESFTFIIDQPRHIPFPYECVTYCKDRLITHYSSEVTKVSNEIPLSNFTFAIIFPKQFEKDFQKYDLDLSVICIHKHESKLKDEHLQHIDNEKITETINELYESLKKMRESEYFDREIQRLINDSDNCFEFCSLKNNFKLSNLVIDYGNIREINLYIGLLNLYQKVWTTIAGYVDITLTYRFSLGNYLKEGMKYIAFTDRKIIVDGLLSNYQSKIQPKDILLNNYIAKTSQNNSITNPFQSKSMFIQLYHELLNEPISVFQNNDQCFRIKYEDQVGIDEGGLFRDALTNISGEIFHSDMRLMIPCSEEMYIPNTKFSPPQFSELYRQVGRIMGISIRNRMNLVFPFPQFIWKLIYNPNLELEESDLSMYDDISIRKCKVINDELKEFKRAEELHENPIRPPELLKKFSIKPYLNEEPAILDKAIDNCFFTITKGIDMIKSFCDLRKRQFISQMRNIHKGILDVIPDSVLSTITYSELEFLVCGKPEIDVKKIKLNTVYVGYKESDVVIQNFWKIFEYELSNIERSKWLYFVTGSYRLPVEPVWKNKFSIRILPGNTDMLPLVHTCFFVVELPPYETYEKLKEKMLKAIEFGIFGIYNY